MLILALDTSSPTGSIGILNNEDVVGVVSSRTDEAFSSRIFRQLEFLLKELNLQSNAFDVFAVVNGPGSFTGLRVGLTAVKGWAEVHRKPVVAVSGLEAIVEQCESDADWIVPAVDARRGQFYYGLYAKVTDSSGRQLEGAESVGTPDELAALLKDRAARGTVSIVTPTPAVVFEKVFSSTNNSSLNEGMIRRASNILAPYAGQIAFRRAGKGQFADSLTLDANYIRRSDAEMNWKGPHER